MLNLRNFKLQLAATSSNGTNNSPVRIKLATGELVEIDAVQWNAELECVSINQVIPEVPIPDPTPEG